MKESIGGAMMLRIILIVVVLFISFLCISANFAKAFKIKNGIIDIIEEYQGINSKSIPKIEDYLSRMAYNCKSNEYATTLNYVLKDNSLPLRGEYYGEKIATPGSFITILGNVDDATSVKDVSYNIQVCMDWNIIGAGGNWTISGKTEIIKDAIFS